MSVERRVANLIRLGNRRRLAGELATAEPLLRKALSLAVASPLLDQHIAAEALNALGLLHKDLARYDEARALYERALLLLARGPVSDSWAHEIATLYHNLGGIEHARGRYVEGERFARQGLALRRRISRGDLPALAADLVALAAILDGQRRFEESEPLYHEALQVFERSPEEHPGELAVALNDLGALFCQRGQLERAEECLDRALALKARTLGTRHPDLAVTLNNLAVASRRRGDRDRAAALYRDALDILECSLGSDHPKTAACRRNRDRCLHGATAAFTIDSRSSDTLSPR